LVNVFADIHEKEALAMVRKYAAEGMPAQQVLQLAWQAMDIIAARFEKGEYSVAELMLTGEMLAKLTTIVKLMEAQDTLRERGMGTHGGAVIGQRDQAGAFGDNDSIQRPQRPIAH
jgi:methanogenic corrinoid protein MtbC1